MVKLIVGCGYLGRRVARRWLDDGHSVAAVTHRPERIGELEALGMRAIVADVTRPETLAGPLRELAADGVLYAVGYDRRNATSRRAVYVDGLRAMLDALPPDTRRALFISSTGVYGHTDGDWVNEDSPCHPMREGGQSMLAGEEALAAHPLGSRAIVLRLAGLYGPGRIPRMAELAAGRPIVADDSGHLNLIHVDDAAAVVVAAEGRAAPPRIYNVADGHPTRKKDFYRLLAELTGSPPPQFAAPAADATPTRGGADKQVNNRQMLNELGITLQYPTYREGLAAVVEARS